jgi:hypothetical protein
MNAGMNKETFFERRKIKSSLFSSILATEKMLNAALQSQDLGIY